MRQFCQTLPEEQLLQGNGDSQEGQSLKGESYRDPETGAKLSYDTSLLVLEQFATTLVGDL